MKNIIKIKKAGDNMTIRKLPSGNYNVEIMRNKKRYSVTFDHKPTKHEAEEALAKKMIKAGERPNGELTFAQASQLYVESKRNVLSPSTIRDYVRYPERLPKWFAEKEIDSITQLDINKVVNELAAKRSPKTIRNYHGFISAILSTFRPGMRIYTTLPQKYEQVIYKPTDEDIRRILAELEGTMFYIPVILSIYGFRRSEILGLTPDCINGNKVYIHRAKVLGEDNVLTEKKTKTAAGTRYIKIPMKIADMIREQGYVYNGAPNSIVVKLEAVEKKLGIPKFSLHKLRHYFASSTEGVANDKIRQDMGGWKTKDVMDQIYNYSKENEYEKAMDAVNDKLESIIFS